MENNSNKKQIILVIDALTNNANSIKKLIEKKNYNEIGYFVTNKEPLTTRLNQLLQTISPEDLSEIKKNEKVKTLKQLELENIKNLELVKLDYKKELNRISKESKIFKAYSGQESITGDILDFDENEYDYE